MTNSKLALHRLDFRLDLMSADAPTINLGYMLEAAIDDGFRFLGLASRKTLTLLEKDRVNFHTWPELGDVDGFMGTLFERAWDHVCMADAQDLRLGSEMLAREHSFVSALYLAPMEMGEAALNIHLNGDAEEVESSLHKTLMGLGRTLRPSLIAPVLPLTPTFAAHDLSPQRKIRFEAEYGLAA